MSPKELVRRLQRIDARVRVIWTYRKVSGIFFHQPRHPDANPKDGMRWIGAIPSASWFYSLPMKDFYTQGDRICLGGVPQGESTNDWEYHRGWKSVVKNVAKHFKYSDLVKEFGWDTFTVGFRGTNSKLPGSDELTKGQLAKKQLGMDYSRIPALRNVA